MFPFRFILFSIKLYFILLTKGFAEGLGRKLQNLVVVIPITFINKHGMINTT